MDFKIENFISSRNLQLLSKTGLHKTAGAMVGVPELTIKQAVTILGMKLRQKRAEDALIHDGIQALGELRGEKVAAGLQLQRWLPHVSQGLPAALLGGGIGYALAPDDPQAENKYLTRGALLGLLGGTLASVNKGL